MKIAFVSAEVTPFSKTGGLADVSGTLPPALAALGHEVLVITPLYASIDRTAHGLTLISTRGGIPGMGGTEIWEGRLGNAARRSRVLFIGAAAFDRAGLYQENSRDYIDNDERFGFFSRAALLLLKHLGFQPDVIHAHDWQAALIPVYLKTRYQDDEFFSRTGSILTIHNLVYQGVFEAARWRSLGLPNHLFRMEALEFYGKINFLKGGIIFSDVVTTVSPRYAREIQTRSFGAGLEGILYSRRHSLTGVLNGLDYDEWSPACDANLFPPYDIRNLAGKSAAKKMLLEKMDMSAGDGNPDPPVMGCVTRLDPQKGCDILLRAMFQILPRTDSRLILLGSGARDLETAFGNLARAFPNKVRVNLKFDTELAKLIYAGSDFFLMPSKYEPCGLGQMIAMSYGTAPVVRLTGGLADTVKPWQAAAKQGNGFGFESYTANALIGTLMKAFEAYRRPGVFRMIQTYAMQERFTWDRAARAYATLYGRAVYFRQKGGGGEMAVKAMKKAAEPVSLVYEIGENAGKVYQYLSDKSEAESIAQIAKGAGLEVSVAAMAIGWLARENNVSVEKAGKNVQVRLIRR